MCFKHFLMLFKKCLKVKNKKISQFKLNLDFHLLTLQMIFLLAIILIVRRYLASFKLMSLHLESLKFSNIYIE